MVKINKKQIFDFFKAEKIVKETKDYINILEKNNQNNENVLKEVKIINLKSDNIYFEVNPENPTYIKSSKPTERVIIEDNDEYINVVFIEMKPPKGKGIQKNLRGHLVGYIFYLIY